MWRRSSCPWYCCCCACGGGDGDAVLEAAGGAGRELFGPQRACLNAAGCSCEMMGANAAESMQQQMRAKGRDRLE
eukprot:scaffold308688_cov12-Tisochrysis_lutea.AAC.1